MSERLTEPRLEPEVVRQIRKGVAEFNAGKFFECHDTFEEVWQGIRGPARDFFQGLIQLAVGFYHLSNGNLIGAESQISKGLEKLENYGDSYAGMELNRLRGEAGSWLERIRAEDKLKGGVSDLPKFRFTPDQ